MFDCHLSYFINLLNCYISLDFTEAEIELHLVDTVQVSIENDTSLVEPRYSSTPSKSDVSESSTSTQSTQLLSVNTPRKCLLKTKVNELKKKSVEYWRKMSTECPTNVHKL